MSLVLMVSKPCITGHSDIKTNFSAVIFLEDQFTLEPNLEYRINLKEHVISHLPILTTIHFFLQVLLLQRNTITLFVFSDKTTIMLSFILLDALLYKGKPSQL